LFEKHYIYMNKNTPRIIISVIIIVIVIGIGYVVLKGGKSGDTTTVKPVVIDNNTAASSSATEEGVSLKGVGITVDDQNPGFLVVVSQVFVNAPSWVVIHEDVNGTPGNILGARLFEKGSNSGIIQLLNSMKVGKSYLAVVHGDNGDGTFDLKKDTILKGTDGKNIMAKFSVTQGSDKPQ
jgi:hypothetical protein